MEILNAANYATIIILRKGNKYYDNKNKAMFVKCHPSSVSWSWSRCWRPSATGGGRRGLLRLFNSLATEIGTTETETAASNVNVEELEEEASSQKSVGRRLILLRHAHSSWDNPSLRDHDRPLSPAGRADAAKLSLKLQQLGWIPQLVLSSDAARTRETLEIMQEQVPALLDAQVHFISSFYSIAAMDGQTAYHLHQSICKYSTDHILTVMCMGHNRGWEEAASMFTGASVELKTCNAALLEAPGSSWEESSKLRIQLQKDICSVERMERNQKRLSDIAFTLAGLGGWKLQGIVKPSNGL